MHDGGRTQVIRRADLEPLWQRLVADGELDNAAIKTVYKFNGSLTAALLASAPGVTASAHPITLRRRA